MSTTPHIGDVASPRSASGAVSVIPASSWISLALLTTTYAIYTIDKAVMSVVIEPLKREFALSDTQVGLLTGLASNLPFLVTCIPLAMLADQVNRKWLLIALVVLWSASTGLAGFATSLGFLVVARVMVGGLEAGFTPLAVSMLGDRFPPQRRPTAMGVFNIGSTTGVFIALAIGGIIVADYGWRWAFFIAGMPGIIMGLVLAIIERDPPRGAFDAVAETPDPVARARLGDAMRVMWRNSLVRYAALGLVLCSALPAVMGTWLPSILIRAHGLSIEDAGFGAAIIKLLTACGAGCGGALADWLGRREDWRKLLAPMVGGSGATIVGLLALFVAPNGTFAVVLLSIMGFISAFYAGIGFATILGSTPPWVRSTVVAIVFMGTNFISSGLGNTLVGLVSDWTSGSFGQNSILYGVASILVINLGGVLAFWQVMRRIRENGKAAMVLSV